MVKRLSARGIKKNRQYTYEDAADTLGVTPQTVRAWRGQGLVVLASTTPHIIMGYALKEFITKRSTKTRQPLKANEVYCVRCKAPRKPFGMMADYVPTNAARGRLVTLCECCEGGCTLFVSASQVVKLSATMQITTSSDWDA